MQAVPSTYHQCIKFPHNGVEITILGDANPFAYCHNISHQLEITVPNNREAISSTSYISPASLASSNTTIPKQEKLKMKIAEEGPGEYNLSQLFCVGQIPTSPRTHGKPQQLLQQPLIMPACALMPFILGKSEEEETQDEDLAKWIYKDPITTDIPQFKLPTDQYGKGLLIMQRMGYDGQSALGYYKQGRHEPLLPEFKPKGNTGLGFEKEIFPKLKLKGKPNKPLCQPTVKRTPFIIKATSSTITTAPPRLKIPTSPSTMLIIPPIKPVIPFAATITSIVPLAVATVSKPAAASMAPAVPTEATESTLPIFLVLDSLIPINLPVASIISSRKVHQPITPAVFNSKDIPVWYSNRMLESDSETDSHEWKFDSVQLNTSDEEDTSLPPPRKDIPVYGEAQIKTSWVLELETSSTDPTSHPTHDSDRESTINNLHHNVLTLSDTSNTLNLIDKVMPIIHPELIEWNQPNSPCLDFFQNDEAIIDFLELRDNLPSGDHKAGFTIELNSATYFGADAKPFSCKNITIKHGSSSENHTMALFDPTKVKRKSISNGENLFEVPEDEGFDILPASTQHERSMILIKETKEYNVGTPENPHLIHLASLLTPEEQPKSIEFFQ
ncbi:hypothetical protein SUGI_1143590 [Cryptomeria japonica]|nr:hypothetical protein SUGI_1143590 [Cryptomeria japonica]